MSCLKLDHKHFAAGTMSSCMLLVYLGPAVMDGELTGGDCNNKNNTAENSFVLLNKCPAPVIRTYQRVGCLKEIVEW